MDTRPTTEESDGLRWDQQLDQPEKKSGVMLPPKVSELRRKLGQKAKQEPKFRFYTLYDRIYRDDVLRIAATLVLNHNGAAGVDGVTCQDLLTLDEPAWNAFFRELHEELRTKRYRPQPVKRVYIPKPDGRMRPLGIPTVKDRIVQTAVLLISSRSSRRTSWTAPTGSVQAGTPIRRSTRSVSISPPGFGKSTTRT